MDKFRDTDEIRILDMQPNGVINPSIMDNVKVQMVLCHADQRLPKCLITRRRRAPEIRAALFQENSDVVTVVDEFAI